MNKQSERKFHTEDEVLQSLRKKKDVRVNPTTKDIQVIMPKVFSEKAGGLIDNPMYAGDLGNGSLGKIDFLVNHLGYTKFSVGKFSI